MPTSFLKNIIYTQLDAKTWCASAQINQTFQTLLPSIICSDLLKPLAPFTLLPCSVELDTNSIYLPVKSLKTSLSIRQIAQSKRQQQRQGVRSLLQSLLIEIGITDLLDESQFPYRLANSGYYVCFSHSSGKDTNNLEITRVAVVLSEHRAVGIDVETQAIAWQVVKRFYHPTEIERLEKLPIAQRDVISKWLWQLKESNIKITQYTLVQGLGKSYAAIIPNFIAVLDTDCTATIGSIADYPSYQISLLPAEQTLVIF